nr:probable anion transporter 3, chloroplastic [Ipomoea batatas]
MVPERFKVVALMACVMALCNADRFVMSVAVVPLAAKYGWINTFLGVVQPYQTENNGNPERNNTKTRTSGSQPTRRRQIPPRLPLRQVVPF